jgi:hypothetical protein
MSITWKPHPFSGFFSGTASAMKLKKLPEIGQLFDLTDAAAQALMRSVIFSYK